jgi:hypothetical protein
MKLYTHTHIYIYMYNIRFNYRMQLILGAHGRVVGSATML